MEIVYDKGAQRGGSGSSGRLPSFSPIPGYHGQLRLSSMCSAGTILQIHGIGRHSAELIRLQPSGIVPKSLNAMASQHRLIGIRVFSKEGRVSGHRVLLMCRGPVLLRRAACAQAGQCEAAEIPAPVES